MYTLEQLEPVFEELESSSEGIRAILGRKGMAWSSFRLARDGNPEVLARYMRAKDERAEWLADQLTAIADDPTLDSNDKRVRIDARKWVASKLLPSRYGEKVDVTSGDKPLRAMDPEAILIAAEALKRKSKS